MEEALLFQALQHKYDFRKGLEGLTTVRKILDTVPGKEGLSTMPVKVPDYYIQSIDRTNQGIRAQVIWWGAKFPVASKDDGSFGYHVKHNVVPTAFWINLGKRNWPPGWLALAVEMAVLQKLLD